MKNSGKIILWIVAIGAIIAFFKYKKDTKSNFLDDSKPKEKPKYCWRVNKAGNGLEKYRCSDSKI